MDVKTRRYIYGVATGALPLLIAAGYVADNIAPLVVAFIGSILVPGLAASNTPSDE